MSNPTDICYFQCLGFNGRYWTFWFYLNSLNPNSSTWLILEALPAQAKQIKEYCRVPDSGSIDLTLDNGSTLYMSQFGAGGASIKATEMTGNRPLTLEYIFDLSIYDVMYLAVVNSIKLEAADESLEQVAEHPLRKNLAQEAHG